MVQRRILRNHAVGGFQQGAGLRERFLRHLSIHNPENKSRGILTGDSVHLNPAGNRFVADQMLDALGVSRTKR